MRNIFNSYEGEWCFTTITDDIFLNADAVILLTEWSEYSKINWLRVSSLMREPAWIFDARSVLSPEEIKKFQS